MCSHPKRSEGTTPRSYRAERAKQEDKWQVGCSESTQGLAADRLEISKFLLSHSLKLERFWCRAALALIQPLISSIWDVHLGI